MLRIAVEAFLTMRCADKKNSAAGCEDEFQFRQAFAQRFALAGCIAIAGDLDIIADDHISAGAGDIARYALRQHGRIAQGAGARHSETVGGPVFRHIGQQFGAKRMGFQNAPDGGDHACGKRCIGRHDQNARGGIAQQKPGAPKPDQG